MLPWILAGLIGSASVADSVTTHQALARGAREAWLPTQQPWAIDAAIASGAVLGSAEVIYLWQRGHKKKALLMTGIVAGVHTAAAIHNTRGH